MRKKPNLEISTSIRNLYKISTNKQPTVLSADHQQTIKNLTMPLRKRSLPFNNKKIEKVEKSGISKTQFYSPRYQKTVTLPSQLTQLIGKTPSISRKTKRTDISQISEPKKMTLKNHIFKDFDTISEQLELGSLMFTKDDSIKLEKRVKYSNFILQNFPK